MNRGIVRLIIATVLGVFVAQAQDAPKLVSVTKIWDEGGHNAFTDLIRYRDVWYCVFREGDGHVGADGKVRVIQSVDGDAWESAALIAEEGIDLRDPKVSITPQGLLMIVAGGSVYRGGELKSMQPRVMFSPDGAHWTVPEPVMNDGDWLWRVTWHKGKAWGLSYGASLKLVSSEDGLRYETVARFNLPGEANETTLRFLPDDTMIALVRRDGDDAHGYIGVSRLPYTNWTWRPTGPHQIGGPEFIRLDDGRMFAAARSYPGGAKTVLARMTESTYEPVLEVPSGGDTSYPGLAWHDGLLWMSYYSSHEGKTSIYLAKIDVGQRDAEAAHAQSEDDAPYLRDWLLLGPLPAGEEDERLRDAVHLSKFETDHLGQEAKASPENGESISIDGNEFAWKQFQSSSDSVELDSAISKTERVLAYAYTEFESPIEEARILAFGSNDGARVWLNGEQVWDFARGRTLKPDEDLVPVVLRKGMNRLLVKVENRGARWGLAARFLPISERVLARLNLFNLDTNPQGLAAVVTPHPQSLLKSIVKRAVFEAAPEAAPDSVVWSGKYVSENRLEIDRTDKTYRPYRYRASVEFAGGLVQTVDEPFYAGAPKDYTLFSGGATDYAILVEPGVSDSEKWAARELSHWLHEASGAEFPILESADAGRDSLIVVGYGPRARKVLGDAARPSGDGDESFTYANRGGTIYIWGGRDRGTMYGVMSFLEREFGVRYYTPKVTLAPRKAGYAFRYLDHSEAPTLRVRNDFYFEAFDTTWAARNRMNGTMTLREQPGGIEAYWAVHTFYPLVPPEEFFETHPEYYSLIDGKRTTDRAQLCLTNPDVLNILTDRLRQTMRDKPEYLIYCVSQNDWYGACQCDKCQTIVQREGSESGPVLWFVNQVAERVEKEFPDKFVGTLAYQYTRKPPLTLRPRNNVVIRLCSIECCFSHDFLSCPQNVSFMDDLRGWAAIAPHMYIWDYVVNFSHYVMPYPNFGVLQSNIQTLRAHNAIGIMEQAAYQCRGGEFAELRMYVLSKLLWNAFADTGAVIDDFMSGYYGRAGQYVREYFDLLQARVTPERHIHLGLRPDDPLFDDEFIRQADAIFDAAEAVADAETLPRVEMARLPVMYLKCRRSPQAAVLDGAYARLKEITAREGVTHYAESGQYDVFHAEMDRIATERK